MGERRRFWQDESEGTLSAGWALTVVTLVVVAVGFSTYLLNDMHMYRYGLFGLAADAGGVG